MKKLAFLFAFVASSLLMWAELPFKPSTDTGNGAIWYLIKWNTGGDGVKCLGAEKLNDAITIQWADPDMSNPADKYLFCFVGNETDGFEIYNKAFLKGKTVGDVLLENDLKFRSMPPSDAALKENPDAWMRGGFANEDIDMGSYTYIDKWLVSDKTNEKGEYMIVDAGKQFGWNKSGGSFIEVDKKVVSEQWAGCFAATFVQVTKEAPFKVSSDTGEGAHWYFIQWYTNEENDFRCWVPNGLNKAIGISWGNPDMENIEDKFLYCFIGNMTDGFKIYNKAYLTGKTVDGVVLNEDLYARELSAGDWVSVGFSNEEIDLSTVVTDWIPVITVSDAMEDCYCLVDVKGLKRAWNKSGASVVETGPNTADWGASTHRIRFVDPYAEPTEPTFVQNTESDNSLEFSVSGRCVKVYNVESAVIDVYSVSGKLVLGNAPDEFYLENGLYIMKAGDKVAKLMVK